MSIEELGIRLSAQGVPETTRGVALAGKAVEDLGKKADAAAPALARTGKTAKETAAAFRLLPAQITDVTTSLISGQPAYLVAIQQGGQIKDSFGGIGPTFKALGSAINPVIAGFLGAAAAAGALVAAYVAGQREAQDYAKAIILSGNAAGVSVDSMSDMARAIDGVVGTQRQAADALTKLVASGQVGQRGLQQFAETAVRMERTMGQSVEETVKTFAELGRAPLAASIKFNESLNYLTLATYGHIKALMEEGRVAEAGAVAQEAFAGAMTTRTGQLEANLGTVQRAWIAVKDAAAETWDEMLGIGREKTLQEKLDAVTEKLRVAALPKSNAKGANGRLSGYAAMTFGNVEALRTEQAALQEQIRLVNRATDARALEAQAVKDTIAADGAKKSAIDQSAAAYAGLHEQIARRMSLAQAELANAGKLSDAERFRAEMLRQIDQAQTKIGASQANRLRGELEATARVIANLEAQREAIKAAADEQQAADKAFEDSQRQSLARMRDAETAAARDTAQIREQVSALAEQTAQIGLNNEALYQRKQMQTEDAIAEKQKRLDTLAGLDAYAAQSDELRQQIELLRELQGVRRENFVKSAQEQDRKDAQARTDMIAQSIEDGILEGFRGGGKVADVFLRELKAQFLNTVLRVPIQLLAQGGSDLLGQLAKLAGGFALSSGQATDRVFGDVATGQYWHSGGVPANDAAFSRSLPASTWAHAPRFHSGIGPGELPSIITKTEGVFTQGQMKAMAPVSALEKAGGRMVNYAPVINIDSRADRADIMSTVNRALRASQADLLDKMNRRMA